MRLEIAPIIPADIPAVMEIERSSNLEPWTEQSFVEEMHRLHSRILVARIPCGREEPPPFAPSMGQVVGYVCFWRVADEIQVLNVAVHKNYRRKGIGRFLLSHVLRFGVANRAGVVVLEVRRSNVAARMLYESMGFHEVGERPNYYGVLKEPAILMELDLAGHPEFDSAMQGD